MKYCLLTGVIILFSVLQSCSKTAPETAVPIDHSLAGKWNYTEYYYSTGGLGEWHAADEPNKWIDFREDGTCSSNLSPFNTAVTYHKVDSTHVQFGKPLSTDSSLFYFFKIDTVKRELQLSPARLICIEGCAQKFSR